MTRLILQCSLVIALVGVDLGSRRSALFAQDVEEPAAEQEDPDAEEAPSESARLLERAQSMFVSAPQAGSRGLTDEAIERLLECESLFDEIVRYHPDSPECFPALFGRSECRRRLARDEEALAGFESLARRRPPEDEEEYWGARVQAALGDARRTLESWDEALAAYRAGFERYPDSGESPRCRYGAGICLRELGRFDEAKVVWADLQRLVGPTDPFARRAGEEFGTLAPVLERLRPLLAEYERKREKLDRAPYKEKVAARREVAQVLTRIGDVRCRESQAFLTQLLAEAPVDLRPEIVLPLLSAGGADAAQKLLESVRDYPVATQRTIFDGIARRHAPPRSVEIATDVAAKAQPLVVESAIRFLGRLGTAPAARALLELIPSGRRGSSNDSTGLISRMLRRLSDPDAWSAIIDGGLRVPPAGTLRRRAVAEALGYSYLPNAGEILAEFAVDKDLEVAVACVESLGRLRAQEWIGVIIAQVQKQRRYEPMVRAGAEALGHLDPTEAAELLIVLWKSPSFAIRTLVVRALGKIDSDPAQRIVIEALADPAWQVRRSALRACGRFPSVALVDALIERLAAETGALLPKIAKLLITLTGVDLGPNAVAWREYWAVEREHWDPRTIAEKPEDSASHTFRKKADASKAESPTYFGVEIISRRVAIIVDVSGSMSGPVTVEREGGGSDQTTKIELAKSELIGAIQKLRKGTHFNVVRFNGTFASMGKSLIKLSPKSLKKALEFARGLSAGGGTNIYDSLEFVLQAGEVDTVFLLSDGAPSAGKYTDTRRILEEIERLNATSQVTIHTIAIGFDSELMRRLAAENDGKSIVVGVGGR
ncbi:MAG: HEAT repeat domain-containing protein [Planctomycetes bacterium]|nr:HEAT repeat domain-containing protein [Planctomycetota bacterium]